jgi:hypothetical protein
VTGSGRWALGWIYPAFFFVRGATMIVLIDKFESQVRASNLRTKRLESADGTIVFIEGEHGSAEMDFRNNGDIDGLIDSDVFHTWQALPNNADVIASAKKICSIIG